MFSEVFKGRLTCLFIARLQSGCRPLCGADALFLFGYIPQMCVGKTNAFQMVNRDYLRVIEKGRIIRHYKYFLHVPPYWFIFVTMTMDRFLYFQN